MPTAWAPWVARDIVVVNSFVGRVVGHVSIAFGHLVVSEVLMGAPTYARRSLVAAAWGRVVRGHLIAVIGSLACFGAAAVIGRVAGTELLGFVVAFGGVISLAWLATARRAREAESIAARIVGQSGVAASRTWRSRFFDRH